MSANLSRGRGRGRGDSGNQRTCPLSGCENIVQGRFIYCSKEHSRQAVTNGEAEGCERCGIYPKNPGHEYCTRACGGLAAAGVPYSGNASVSMSFWTMQVNPNAPSQSGGQPSAGRGYGNQNQSRGGGGGRNAGRGRGRIRNDEEASDRLSTKSGGSVKTTADGGLRTFHFGPCNCSVRTRVTPTTAYCPVCNDPCDQVLVEQDGTFKDFLGTEDTIDEEPSTDDTQPQPSQTVVPQPGPTPQPPVTAAPQPPVISSPHPFATAAPQSPVTAAPQPPVTAASEPASEDRGQQMIEVNNAQPASLMPRVTVRRLPVPPKPVGPRPAPEHPMDIDFPDISDVADAQFESPTEARPTPTGGYGQDGVQPSPRPAFGDEDSLPFVPVRRPSPMPPHEGRTAASPTSPVDPFVQPNSYDDSYELEMEDPAPAPVTPVPPVTQVAPATQVPPATQVAPVTPVSPVAPVAPVTPVYPFPQPQVYNPPSPPANPFGDSASVSPSQPARETEQVPQEVIKENKSNSLPAPSQWEGYDTSGASGLKRTPAVSSVPGPQRTTSDPVESSAKASGTSGLPNGSSGFQQPPGGYELRGSRPQNAQSHLRSDSDGLYDTEQLRAPSPLLNPGDLGTPSPTPSPLGRNNSPANARRNPSPGGYLTAPTTTMPNGNPGRRTPSPTRSRPHSATGTRPVMISEKQGESHFGLSNLSYTPINYPDPNTAFDKQYPTPEHLFQAMKFIGHKPLIAEHIRTCGGNPKPREEARRFAYEQDPTWSTTCLDRMYEVLQLKFKAYPGLEVELLDTGEADLVLDSSDQFWGRGADDRGHNNLGSLLMRLRQELVEGISAQIDQTD